MPIASRRPASANGRGAGLKGIVRRGGPDNPRAGWDRHDQPRRALGAASPSTSRKVMQGPAARMHSGPLVRIGEEKPPSGELRSPSATKQRLLD